MNTEKLRNNIQAQLRSWDERSFFVLSGCGKLTKSDIDTLLMCCDWYDKYGNLNGLSYFSREVARVLRRYGAKLNKEACV